jgi:hypothetical protein
LFENLCGKKHMKGGKYGFATVLSVYGVVVVSKLAAKK